jgi:sulfur relay (sulfurtransferase) DsrF/TusC family protein
MLSDKLCEKLGLYKLYTIGDCYVVLSMLKARSTPELEAAKVMEFS